MQCWRIPAQCCSMPATLWCIVMYSDYDSDTYVFSVLILLSSHSQGSLGAWGLGSPRKTGCRSLSGSGDFATWLSCTKWNKWNLFFSVLLRCKLTCHYLRWCPMNINEPLCIVCWMKHDLVIGGKRTRSRRFCIAFAAARRGITITFLILDPREFVTPPETSLAVRCVPWLWIFK